MIKHLTPKSKEELKVSIESLSIDDKLVFGAESKNLELIKYALSHGADIHYECDLALRWAVYQNDYPITKLLLDAGANKHNKIYNFMYDAVEWAFEKHFNEIFDLLRNYD